MFLVKDKFVICNFYDKCHAYFVHIDLLCICKDLLEENKYNTIQLVSATWKTFADAV